MACQKTRKEVADVVVRAIREIEKNENITEETRFWDDLGVDQETRRGYFRPIRKQLDDNDCVVSGLAAGDLEKCVAVKDVVDKFSKSLRPRGGR